MVKYYEKTKSQYARDIDHLVTFNNNGLWIKEPYDNGERIISAETIQENFLSNVMIFELDKNFEIKQKFSQSRKHFTKKLDFKKLYHIHVGR